MNAASIETWKNYWTLCQHNRARFGTKLEEDSVETSINLLWWWIVKVRIYMCSLVI